MKPFLLSLLTCFFATVAVGQLTLSGTSYSQNFDNIGSGLPTGWTVRTGASGSNRGTSGLFTNTINTWGDNSGAFKNLASSEGLTSVSSTLNQDNSTNRSLGVRQSGTFGDPGASFELEILNTINRKGFTLSLEHHMLSVQARSTTWSVQYSTNGTTWTTIGTYSDPGVFGKTDFIYDFGTALDNRNGTVLIRVVALTGSSNTGSRDTYGIDDFSLSWTNCTTTYYADADGDGFGNPAVSQVACEQPTGYVTNNTDCDDMNNALNPNTIWYGDLDEDGFGDPSETLVSCTQPQFHVLNNLDCDDLDENINPNTQWYKDADNDGYAATGASVLTQCLRPMGYKLVTELLASSGDCNDENPAILPGATEVCDGIDNDCDGLIDEGVPTNNDGNAGIFESYVIIGPTFYDLSASTTNPNFEGTNLGTFATGSSLVLNGGEIKTYKNSGANICGGKLWYAIRSVGSASPLSFISIDLPFAENLPSSGDQRWAATMQAQNILQGRSAGNYELIVWTSASGNAPGAPACICPIYRAADAGGNYYTATFSICTPTTWYADADNDGFGNPAVSQESCTQPSGYVSNNTDCNDSNNAINPNTQWYKDTDNDGYAATGASVLTQCLRPMGYKLVTELLASSGDCDDENPAILPGATEVCDGVDNNCNGDIDEGFTLTTYYADTDNDGYGDPNVSIQACTQPVGYVTNNLDSDDTDPDVSVLCGPGFYFDSTAGICTSCPLGTYCPGGTTAPIPCAAGSFASMTGQSSCTLCAAGTAQPMTGQIACVACAAGSFSDVVGSVSCTACPINTYNDQIGQTTCISCPVGSTSGVGATVCTSCGPGTYLDENTGQCTTCPLGTYCPGGTTAPIPCAAGSFASMTGQSSCTLCAAGTAQPMTGQIACVACAAGSFSDVVGSVSCTACPINTYNDQIGQTTCISCPVGSTSGVGATVCTSCGPGTYLDENTGQCTTCPLGTYCPGGTTAPIPCAAGSFASMTGQSSCTLCAAGTAQPMTGQIACVACAAGSFSDVVGSVSCTACPINTYNDQIGQTTCISCPVGSTSGVGATVCTSCGPGTYLDENTGQCTTCPLGTYCPGGTTAPIPCAAGSFASMTGQSSCTLCAAGTAQPMTGQIACVACAAGSFSDVVGSVSCTACPINTYNDQIGQTTCISCPVGSTSGVGATACTSCGPGTYLDENTGQCTTCPLGTYCPGGTTAPIPCAAGSFASVTGQSSCTLCAAGTAQPMTGQIACVACAAGSFSNVEGSAICQQCGPGTFQGQSGQTSCNQCPVGTYNDQTGMVECIECPIGTNSTPGSISCFDDTDGDGIADHLDNCPLIANNDQLDIDQDGVGAVCDCDDNNSNVYPNATEICDGLDNDCDGLIDEGVPTNNDGNAGIFESYVIIGPTYYDLSAVTMNPNFAGANLGTFETGGSLVLNGGEIKTYKNSGANFCGGKLWYAVRAVGSSSPLNFISIDLDFIEDLPTVGDQKWAFTTQAQNILQSLPAGNYELIVWTSASGNAPGAPACICPIYRAADAGGNYYTATFSICNPPTASISGGAHLNCTVTSVTRTASGGVSYAWSTGANSADIMVSMPGTYTVTVTDAVGCTASISTMVTQDITPPNAQISGSDELTCTVTSVTRTASGGVSYAWSNGANTSEITVNTAGTYTVTVTASNGCTGTASTVVSENINVVNASISGSLNLTCTTTSVNRTASGGTSYVWSNGANTAMTSFTMPGTYTVTVTDAAGCTGTASTNVTQNITPPNAMVAGINNLCEGSSTTLTASGGNTYVWSTGAMTASITVTPSSTTTYTVTATSVTNGCTATASRTVTVNPLPDITISGTDNLSCAVTSVTRTASGGTFYNWSTGGNTAQLTVSSPGTYTVTVTSTVGCTSTASTVVTQDITAPNAQIAGSDNLTCTVTSVTRTASGGVSYAWSNGANTSEITVNTAGTYTVTVTASNGCTTTASTMVSENINIVNASISGSLNLTCTTTSVNRTASGGVSYVWSNGANTAMTSFTMPGTYTVTVTDAAGCTGTASTNVTQNITPPNAMVVGTNTLCEGSSTTLTASGGNTYVWSTGAMTASITVTPPSTTTYTVTATSASNGCTATASRTVTVNPLPDITISGTDNLSCAVTSVTRTASGGTFYLWNTGANTAQLTVSSPGTYTVTVTSSVGCTSTASTVVTQDITPPNAQISGSDDLTCTVTSVTRTASGGVSYAWSNGANTAETTITSAGTYTVTVTASNGCTSTASTVVSENITVPNVEISGEDQLTCTVTTVTRTASGGISYAWSNGANSAEIAITDSGTYTVTVSDSNGCTSTASAVITQDISEPNVNITGSGNLGCGQTSVTRTANGGVSYVWSTGANTAEITITSPGTYIVTVTGSNGCTNTASTMVLEEQCSQLEVRGNTVLIPRGSTTPNAGDFTDFGLVVSGQTRVRTFTVGNAGLSPVTLTGNPRITVDNPLFEVTTQPGGSNVLNPGISRNFRITFYGDAPGIHTAVVTIPNSETSGTYTYTIQAEVRPAAMEVRGNNQLIANGSMTPQFPNLTNFGGAVVGFSKTVYFYVHNVGTGTLSLTNPNARVEVLLADMSTPSPDFTVTQQPVATVAPGANRVFKIQFRPLSVGPKEAYVRISNNDFNNDPYVYKIVGNGLISVSMQGSNESMGYDLTDAETVELMDRERAEKEAVAQIALYPNPAFDQVTVRNLDESAGTTILRWYDSSGRLAKQEFLDSQNDRTIRVTDLQPGVYMVQIQQGNAVHTVKWIKIE